MKYSIANGRNAVTVQSSEYTAALS